MATIVGTVNLTGCSYSLAYDVLSQNIATNSSTVRLYGILSVSNNYVAWSSGTASVHDSGDAAIGTSYNRGDHVVITRDYTWTHDANGNWSGWVGASLKTTFVSGNTGGVITLPKINRVAVTNSVEGQDVEGNFKVNYTAFISAYTYKLRISIPHITELQTTDYISGTNISLSNEALTKLLGTNPQTQKPYIMGNSINLGFAVETWNGGTQISAGNEVIKKCYLYNAEPTYDVAYQDTNAATIAITNNNQQIIRNNSTLQINFTNMDAKKSASLASAKIIIDNQEYTGTISGTTCNINVGTINLTSDIEASVVVTDTRNVSTTKPLAITILDWQLPTGIITLERQSNYYSETDITVDANYSSLDSKNQLTLKVRYKKETDSTYGNYVTLQNNVTTVLTLDNLYTWDVQVLVQDLLGSTTYNLSLGIGLPIFYIDRHLRSVGIECFPSDNNSLEILGVNVLEVLNGLVGNKIWTNTSPDSSFASQTITLTEDLDTYNCYEIIFRQNKTSTRYFSTGKIPVGHGTILNAYSNNFRPTGTTVSGNTITFENASVGGTTNNEYVIPVYVIAYKTNLFS